MRRLSQSEQYPAPRVSAPEEAEDGYSQTPCWPRRLTVLASQESARSGVWHVFCSLSRIAPCLGHVWHREAEVPCTRRACLVEFTQGNYPQRIRRNPMAIE